MKNTDLASEVSTKKISINGKIIKKYLLILKNIKGKFIAVYRLWN